MIMHIDMDAFFASIEQAVNPRLANKPLIIGSRNNKMHTVVCAASYPAKARGIRSGMLSGEAFKLCPNLEFVPADQSKYIWTSEEIFKLLKAYGFELDYASIDEFRMEIKNHSQPQELAKEIQGKIQKNFRITASVGIAKNCLLAKLASKLNKPNGISILKEENLSRVLSLTTVKKLCGIGEKSQEILSLLGIKTCLDLYQKSADFLEKSFGQNGINLYISLHSQETLGMEQEKEKPKSIGHLYTLPRASQTPGFIKAWLRLLSEMAGQRLREKNLISNTVFLWLNGPEIGNFRAQKTYSQGTNDSYEIWQRTVKIMSDAVKLRQKLPKIRAIGLTCRELSTPEYPPLFQEQKRREELIKTIDLINHKFGEETIYPAVIDLTRNMA